MSRFSALSLTVALPLCFLAGCAGSGGDATETVTVEMAPSSETATPSAMATDVPIIAKVAGQDLRVSDPMLGLVNQSALTKLGLDQIFADQGVELDPAQHSVILLSLGQQPTGGFAADITALQRKGDELFVQGTAAQPTSTDNVTQAQTFPFAAVAVEKLPAGIKIRSDVTSLP